MRDRAWAVLCLLFVPVATTTAQTLPGKVMAHQKVSATEGGFSGPLDHDDFFGCALTAVGDLDGDGITELAVGAERDDDGPCTAHDLICDAGAVWILFLDADGTVRAEQKISATEGGFAGVLEPFDNFGFSLAPLGDLDGDGTPDLAVGAVHDKDGGGGHGEGAVWILFLRPDGTVKSHQAISASQGGLTAAIGDYDHFGNDVDALGDFDGDGVVDLLVGARFAHGESPGDGGGGTIWIVFLHPDGTVKGHAQISEHSGGFSGDLQTGDRFGWSVASLGDLDGDGVTDIAVGSQRDSEAGPNAGAVWVLRLDPDGSVKAHQKINGLHGGFTGDVQPGEVFGQALAGLGDHDGDGTPDLAVGSMNDDGGNDTGAVWILNLNADGSVKSHQKISASQGDFSGAIEANDRFGFALAALGDLDGDGKNDLAVGARFDDDGGLTQGDDLGAVWMLFLHQGIWQNLGFSLAGAGGHPRLDGAGSLEHAPILLDLENAPPSTLTTLILGFDIAALPSFGGTLVPASDVVLLRETNALGAISVSGNWLAGAPSGAALYVQAWVRDTGALQGFAASNAVSATVP